MATGCLDPSHLFCWLDIGGAPSRAVVTEIALHYDPLVVRNLFVPDPIARLLTARLR
jgi:hypothetical protein